MRDPHVPNVPNVPSDHERRIAALERQSGMSVLQRAAAAAPTPDIAADKPAPVMTATLLSQADIDALGTYDHSLPTGTRIGKRWKKSDGKGGWKMGEYVEDADPKMVGIRWTTIHVKGQTADQPAGDDAVEDGSHNDIGFLRRSLADMHAHADALKNGWDACDEQRKEAMTSLERALAEVADLRAKLAATKTCYEAQIEKEQEDAAHWKQEYDGAMAANGRLAAERDLAVYKEALSGAQDNAAQWKERAELAMDLLSEGKKAYVWAHNVNLAGRIDSLLMHHK